MPLRQRKINEAARPKENGLVESGLLTFSVPSGLSGSGVSHSTGTEPRCPGERTSKARVPR